MATGWRYRVASVLGTASLTGLAVTVANRPVVQHAFAAVPFFGNPAPEILPEGEVMLAIWTAVFVVLATMWPLFKPRPRRILDTIMVTQKRVLLGMVGLSALGYFKYSHRIPRSTLMLATVVLLVLLPLWHLAIRRRPQRESRAIIVGDDPGAMDAILAEADLPVIGYVSPPSRFGVDEPFHASVPAATDGGQALGLSDLPVLGGLSRLDDVLVEHDVDTVLLAFASSDRAEFFGALAECHEHGVHVKAHRDHADSVLLADTVTGGDVVEIDLEPWDWQTLVAKRVFDVLFALSGLLVLSPLMAVIAIAIKLDSPGPVLYEQERTAEFGERFSVYKFRSMRVEGESAKPGEETDRVTKVGRLLRDTHIDEIPQLWSILVGDMSVVGPRAAWADEELLLEQEVSSWSQRWFVKPGLTGLAQINDASSERPREKLRYDIEYVRRQSFWLDLKVVVRQLWLVATDLVDYGD
ncbi:sugar transferase [Halobacteriales archaeon Cl-PHB]